MSFAKDRIHERAAHPKHLDILDELPKTAVGKVFKPALRKLAIKRVFNAVLADVGAEVVDVVEDKKRGLVAQISRPDEVDQDGVSKLLSSFTTPWEWAA